MTKIVPIFIVCIQFLLGQVVFAQFDCGTQALTAQEQQKYEQFVSRVKQKRTASRVDATISYIPVKVHIVTKSDGTGSVGMGELNNAIAIVNSYYINSGIQFYFCNATPNYIANNNLYNYAISQESILCTTNDVTDAINLYILNSIIYTGGTNVTGYAYFPSTDKRYNRAFVKASAINDNKTLAHELGHFFSLYHTFQNNSDADLSKRELSTRGSGANCATTGDLLCDTPADPYGMAGATVSGCTYTGTIIDGNGQVYAPHLNNIMSYYAGCGNVFTTEQYARIQTGWLTRQDLISTGSANYNYTCSPTSLTPPSNLSTAAASSGIVLTWSDNTSNEYGYIIERSTNANGPFVSIAGVAPNITTYTDASVTSNTTYYYRVKASNTTDAYSNVTSTVTGLYYCNAKYEFGCDDGENIADFVVAGTTLSRINSGCSSGGYGNYTGTPVNVTAGTSYNFTARAVTGGVGIYYPQQLSIWVDANRDGAFSSNEMVFQSNSNNMLDPTLTGTITIPANALSGIARMRVRSQVYDPDLPLEGQVTDPCVKYDLGETEDYALNIGVSSGSPTITTGTVSPASICAGANISVSFSSAGTFSAGNVFSVEITDASGNAFSSITSTGSSSPLTVVIPSNLPAGSNYKVRVKSSSPAITGSASSSFVINSLPNATANGNGSPVCGGSPLNLSANGGTSYLWAGPAGYSSTQQNPSIVSVSSTIAGIYTVTAYSSASCTQTATVSIQYAAAPNISVSNNSPVCAGGTVSLSSSNSSVQSYNWTGPNGFNSTQQNPIINNVTNSATGIYTLQVINQGCSASATTSIQIGSSNAQAGSNSPVCVGSALNISASGGSSYLWAGPNGYTSIVANPSLSNVAINQAGIYTVTVNNTGCTTTLTISVIVNTSPAAVISGTQTILQGNSANLSITLSGTSPFTFLLSNGTAITNTSNNPYTLSVSPTTTTTYSLASVSNTCGNGTVSGSATVNVTPLAAQNSINISSPNFGTEVCIGSQFSLSYTLNGTYNVGNAFTIQLSDNTGGNFTNLSTNINNNTLIASIPVNATIGSGYRVRVVSSSPVVQSTQSDAFTIKALPTVQALAQSPICKGTTVQLSSSGGGSYLWSTSAAANFSSTAQNPSISNIDFANIGTYSVKVTGSNGCSNTASINIDVVSNDATTSASSNTPLVSGSIITLSATGSGTFTWAGPNKFSSVVANPSISNATSIMTGIYTVTIKTSNNCTATATTSVTVIAPTNTVTIATTCVTLDIKVFLEGPYSTSTGKMNTKLNLRGLLPGQTPVSATSTPTLAGQPYNVAPWTYTGTESLTSYPSDVVDWVLVSIRTNNSSANSNLQKLAGLLLSDGKISFLNGMGCISVPPDQSYWIVIEHRNHLGIMSPVAVSVVNNSITYDFTAQDSFVNTPSFGQKQLSNGKWVMYAADGRKTPATQNYDINTNDSQEWKSQSGNFDKYRNADYNLDADINATDIGLWRKNAGKYSKVPH
jgi:GEVED domain/Pregnancy-associated plasma protein-A